MSLFLDDDEESNIEEKDNETDASNASDGISLIGGLNEETLFTSSHTLNYFSSYVVCLPTENFVLTEKSNDDPIEHRFSLNRSLSGHHLALHVENFTQK